MVDATVSPAVVSAATTATLSLPGFTASLTVAYSLQCAAAGNAVVGRCRLTASKPVLKAPTVPALEAIT